MTPFNIKRNIALASLSTFGIGGQAEYFVSAQRVSELKSALNWARRKDISWKIFAGGSNIVFPDGMLSGLLIKMAVGEDELEQAGDNTIIYGGALPLQRAVDFANKNGFAGLETLAGIPGTVGGAIVGNAGAYGRLISESVKKVETFDTNTFETQWITEEKCGFGYRESVFKHQPFVVLRAELEFVAGNSGELKRKSKEVIETRLKKYTSGMKCLGSFFKNIPLQNISPGTLKKIKGVRITEDQVPTGYILELVGARGMKRGGVQIADFHGNLFINTGGGTARDVKILACELKDMVRERFGITLEEEVRYF